MYELFQIRLGKIQVFSNMESSGDMTFEMFWSNVSTNGAWKQVLLDVCSAKDEIAPQKWWKVGPNEASRATGKL